MTKPDTDVELKQKALAALDKFAAIGAGGDTPVPGDEMPEEAA